MQRRGMKKVAALHRHYSASASSSSNLEDDTIVDTPPTAAPLSDAERAAIEAQLIEKDKALVKAELERYEAAGLVKQDGDSDMSSSDSQSTDTDSDGSDASWEDEEEFDLLRFWQVCREPLIFSALLTD